ncbi:MAG: hypothetical protein WAW39_29975 [Prosthecobacter sp.]|uniref:hypothetical protein n=1 Tax=Prosthecobacter sp. TaxID=1965333 RepID=UPI003BB1FAF0
MKVILSILLVCTLSACGPTPQKQTRAEITGTQTERVTRATAILAKYATLPGPLLDAHMAEDIADNSGGMVPGPSDSTLSGVITFPAADLPKWQKILAPQTSHVDSPSYGGHSPAPTWWPAAAAFKDCEYYEPKKLTGRTFGFVALSPSAAAIYFSTFSP